MEKLRIECRPTCGRENATGSKVERRRSGRETDEDEDDEDDMA